MNPSQINQEIDHHVQTNLLIEHLDINYLYQDIGIRNALNKFANERNKARWPNKFWASKSGPAFVRSIILAVVGAAVDDSKDRIAKKGRHAPGFYSAYQQQLDFDTSEDDDEVEWIPGQVIASIDTEAVKAANSLLNNLKRKEYPQGDAERLFGDSSSDSDYDEKRKPSEELQADVDAINQQIAAARKVDAEKAPEKKKSRKA